MSIRNAPVERMPTLAAVCHMRAGGGGPSTLGVDHANMGSVSTCRVPT